SEDTETRGEVTLPAYRGDLINRAPYTAADRTPDPALLLRVYERAGVTINFIGSLIEGGFADLHHPEYWNLAWVKHSPHAEEYHRRVGGMLDSLHFRGSCTGPR